MTAPQTVLSLAAAAFIAAAAGALIWRGVLDIGRAQNDDTP